MKTVILDDEFAMDMKLFAFSKLYILQNFEKRRLAGSLRVSIDNTSLLEKLSDDIFNLLITKLNNININKAIKTAVSTYR